MLSSNLGKKQNVTLDTEHVDDQIGRGKKIRGTKFTR